MATNPGIKKVFVTKLTDVLSTDKEGVGSVRIEGGNTYKWCHIKHVTATVAGAAGSLVGYFAGTGYGNNQVCVDLSDADTIPVCAGALLATVAGVINTDYYCWVQTKGPVTLDTAVTSGAAGKSFFLTSTDKTATVGANAYDQKAGISLNGTTSVLLTCPD